MAILPRGSRILATAILMFAGVVGAAARNEAAVGQCGLKFMHSLDRCNSNYGGFSQSIRLQACIRAATGRYNSCMDSALAAPAMATTGPNDPPKKRNLPTPPATGLLEGGSGIPSTGPAPSGGSRGTRGTGGTNTLY